MDEILIPGVKQAKTGRIIDGEFSARHDGSCRESNHNLWRNTHMMLIHKTMEITEPLNIAARMATRQRLLFLALALDPQAASRAPDERAPVDC